MADVKYKYPYMEVDRHSADECVGPMGSTSLRISKLFGFFASTSHQVSVSFCIMIGFALWAALVFSKMPIHMMKKFFH